MPNLLEFVDDAREAAAHALLQIEHVSWLKSLIPALIAEGLAKVESRLPQDKIDAIGAHVGLSADAVAALEAQAFAAAQAAIVKEFAPPAPVEAQSPVSEVPIDPSNGEGHAVAPDAPVPQNTDYYSGLTDEQVMQSFNGGDANNPGSGLVLALNPDQSNPGEAYFVSDKSDPTKGAHGITAEEAIANYYRLYPA